MSKITNKPFFTNIIIPSVTVFILVSSAIIISLFQ
jgi:hypothetical protein